MKKTINMKKIHYSILMQTLLFGLLLSVSTDASSQTKMEKEERIKEKDVPENARTFLDEAGAKNKIKWYKDIGQNEMVIEAKTKHRGTLYSIEFDTAGQIINVEYIIKFRRLAPKIKENIKKQLDVKFKKYSIIKTQKQYTGQKAALKELIRNNETDKQFTTRYEIVLKGAEENYKRKYELTTDSSGEFIEIEEIVEPDMDILIY